MKKQYTAQFFHRNVGFRITDFARAVLLKLCQETTMARAAHPPEHAMFLCPCSRPRGIESGGL